MSALVFAIASGFVGLAVALARRRVLGALSRAAHWRSA
jgi:hypothetical protein